MEETNLPEAKKESDIIFDNFQVRPDQIPRIEQVEFEKLEKDYLWMRLTSWSLLLFVCLGCLVIVGFNSDADLWMLTLPWLIFLVFIFVVEIKGFKIKGYAIRQNDISYKSGLIFFSMTSIPFNRIQHVEVSQGPLGRLFDLASVKVYTAGGSTSDLSIGGLKKEEAHKLRDHISQVSSQYA